MNKECKKIQLSTFLKKKEKNEEKTKNFLKIMMKHIFKT